MGSWWLVLKIQHNSKSTETVAFHGNWHRKRRKAEGWLLTNIQYYDTKVDNHNVKTLGQNNQIFYSDTADSSAEVGGACPIDGKS